MLQILHYVVRLYAFAQLFPFSLHCLILHQVKVTFFCLRSTIRTMGSDAMEAGHCNEESLNSGLAG